MKHLVFLDLATQLLIDRYSWKWSVFVRVCLVGWELSVLGM